MNGIMFSSEKKKRFISTSTETKHMSMDTMLNVELYLHHTHVKTANKHSYRYQEVKGCLEQICRCSETCSEYKVRTRISKGSFKSSPLPDPSSKKKYVDGITYPEYQGTMSKKSGFICFFFVFSYSSTDKG